MFIDTNVWVYAHCEDAPKNAVAQQQLLDIDETGEIVCTSRQILREYVSTVTRSWEWSQALSMESALLQANILVSTCEMLEDGPAVYDALMFLCRNVELYGRSIFDANIVATMLAHGDDVLFTFNFKDFRRYEKYIKVVHVGAES